MVALARGFPRSSLAPGVLRGMVATMGPERAVVDLGEEQANRYRGIAELGVPDQWAEYHVSLSRKLAEYDVAYFIGYRIDDYGNEKYVSAYAVDLARWKPDRALRFLESFPEDDSVHGYRGDELFAGMGLDSHFRLRAGRIADLLDRLVLRRERRKSWRWTGLSGIVADLQRLEGIRGRAADRRRAADD